MQGGAGNDACWWMGGRGVVLGSGCGAEHKLLVPDQVHLPNPRIKEVIAIAVHKIVPALALDEISSACPICRWILDIKEHKYNAGGLDLSS